MMLIFSPLDVGQKYSSMGPCLSRFPSARFRGVLFFARTVRRLAFFETAIGSPIRRIPVRTLSRSLGARQSEAISVVRRWGGWGGAGRPRSAIGKPRPCLCHLDDARDPGV